MEIEYRTDSSGIIFQVSVIPNSSQSCIIGITNGVLRLKLNSPPIEGRANKEVIEFFSKFLHVPKSSIKILKGEKSKLKTLHLKGNLELLQEKINSLNI